MLFTIGSGGTADHGRKRCLALGMEDYCYVNEPLPFAFVL